MNCLDLTLPTPAENLALDEALLEAAEAAPPGAEFEVLRFWESPVPFVVLGYGNHAAAEVDLDACRERGIAVLRRASGGGAVVQGPGCLSYAVILRLERARSLASIPLTNAYVMDRQRRALEALLGVRIQVQGITDLTLGNLKFSGNAQRRKRHALLFHGTLLLDFDLELLGRVLRPPSREPDYRAQRPHARFVQNLLQPAFQVKQALRRMWQAEDPLRTVPEVAALVREKYALASWNFKY